jgi:hypothetical protein
MYVPCWADDVVRGEDSCWMAENMALELNPPVDGLFRGDARAMLGG